MKKLSNEQIIDAKNEIMHTKKSISSKAKELGIDRKTLKARIMDVLDETEKKEFEEKLSNNLRKNKVSIIRQKRMDKENKYKEVVEELVKKGITKTDIEMLHMTSSSNVHSKMAKDTFVIKLLDLLNFCDERNKGLKEGNAGYISKQDLLNMILRDKKFISNDINNKINPICDILDRHPDLSREEINEAIKGNPHMFRNSVAKIDMLSIIGENFLVTNGMKYTDLFKYMLQIKPHMLAINPEKLFKRLSSIVDYKHSTIIHKDDLEEISRNTYKNSNVKIDESKINLLYEFPEYNKNNSQEFRKKIRESLDTLKNGDKEKEQ